MVTDKNEITMQILANQIASAAKALAIFEAENFILKSENESLKREIESLKNNETGA